MFYELWIIFKRPFTEFEAQTCTTSAWTQPRRVEPLRVWFGGVGDHALLAVLPFS